MEFTLLNTTMSYQAFLVLKYIVIAPDRSNVTLRINGTSIVDINVTIECQNIIDPILGYTESLF
jgi:hypothetical protein